MTASDHSRASGDAAGAIKARRTAIQLVPDAASRTLALGTLLKDSGQHAEAIELLHEALRLNPRLGDAATGLQHSYSSLGMLDEGMAWCRKAIQMTNPDLVHGYNNVASTLIVKGGSLDESEKAIHQALRLEPSSTIAVLTLAELRQAQGRFVESLEVSAIFIFILQNY